MAQGGSTLSSAQWLSTLDDTNHDHHERNDQENMNHSAQCVRGKQTSQPQDDQDDCDGFEHLLLHPSRDAARLKALALPVEPSPVAYACHGTLCSAPVQEPNDLLAAVEEMRRAGS